MRWIDAVRLDANVATGLVAVVLGGCSAASSTGGEDAGASPDVNVGYAVDAADIADGRPSVTRSGEGGGGDAAAAANDAAAGAEAGSSGEGGDADAGEAGSPDECSGGTTGPASDSPSATASVGGYGHIDVVASTRTQIARLRTTLAVPSKPAPSGTLFLWPGLEPLTGGSNFNPIGEGVLQPVLTWGTSCAPGTQPKAYSSWWISAQYVNTLGNYTGYTGCHGGATIDVAVGDLLDIDMALGASPGSVWTQTVTDRMTGETATFAFDMLHQGQNWAMFVIEEYSSHPVSDVVFTGTTITMADADPGACQPTKRGSSDYFGPPRASADGKRCCLSKVILRASGVAATTPNTP